MDGLGLAQLASDQSGTDQLLGAQWGAMVNNASQQSIAATPAILATHGQTGNVDCFLSRQSMHFQQSITASPILWVLPMQIDCGMEQGL